MVEHFRRKVLCICIETTVNPKRNSDNADMHVSISNPGLHMHSSVVVLLAGNGIHSNAFEGMCMLRQAFPKNAVSNNKLFFF